MDFFLDTTSNLTADTFLKVNCKVESDIISINFNIAEYEKVIDMISDSTLQLTFKKLSAVKFDVVSRKKSMGT